MQELGGSSSGSRTRSPPRIKALPTVTYSEEYCSPLKKRVKNVETVIKEASKPDVYTQEQEKIMLGDPEETSVDVQKTTGPPTKYYCKCTTAQKPFCECANCPQDVMFYICLMNPLQDPKTSSAANWDEELNAVADKLCKAIMDYIFPAATELFRTDLLPHYIKKPVLDTEGNYSQFLAFSQQYKSKFDKFMERYSRVGIYPKKDVLPDPVAEKCPIAMLHNEDVLKRYKNFKRFDTVKDYSDHLFSTKPMEQASTTEGWAKNMREQWRILEENLPETIFVRVYEGRMDLLRALIIGPKGTPYHDGLFFFDVYFPSNFPFNKPLVRYHSGGFGINPHMFECGEVRLNIFGEHLSDYASLWPSWNTTILQLLVSIQDRVLNADPLFHQPVSQDFGPSVVAEYLSLLYNEDILIKSLKTMMHIMNKPPKNFEAFVVGHFCNRQSDILLACKAYMEGLQVGGGVGNKDSCCSIEFRKNVDSCILQLLRCFERNIGLTKPDLILELIRSTPPADSNEIAPLKDDVADGEKEVIMDYIDPPRPWEVGMPYYIKRSQLDTQVSCSRFLAFSQRYKSKFDKFMERFVRVGIYPKEDVLPDYSARACPIATLDDEDVLKRYKNFKRFDTVKDYSDHLFSAKPMEQASVDMLSLDC
ncbi:hypothetical protein SSX86_005359 [Deinandra increscens subsp. villosa]|uniref:UBC core domain-containing protein n=1 Tax=Deinandra increscens subsp. villosa TaxID=3103831 RepID=A0AAP0H8F0_9ASTR